MKKGVVVLLLAAALALLASCGGGEQPGDEVYAVGDKISTAFFDYTVTQIEHYSRYEGKKAQSGSRLIVVTLEIKNTQHYAMPMGRYDFQLQWGGGEDGFGYPLEQYCQAQLPDEYDIPEGESVQGVLVFQAPSSKRDLALGFLEVFENDDQGKAYYTYFTLGG